MDDREREIHAAYVPGAKPTAGPVVLAEPDIAADDCRIEWADGGLTRDRGRLDAAIGEAVTSYLAVQRTT